MYIFFTKEWFIDNLISELIFGVILIGGAMFCWKYIRDAYRTFQIFQIISIHNHPSRTRRKGIHARDRFMDIYEAKVPIISRPTAYNTGFIDAVFQEYYIDWGILELHGLVTIKDTRNGVIVEANKDRITRWVYRLAKIAEDWEKARTDRFVLDKSEKLRRLPKQ